MNAKNYKKISDFKQFSVFFFFFAVFPDFRNLRETGTVSNSKQLGAIYEKRGCVIFAKKLRFSVFSGGWILHICYTIHFIFSVESFFES